MLWGFAVLSRDCAAVDDQAISEALLQAATGDLLLDHRKDCNQTACGAAET
ncbi:hypothetical protein MPUL_34370 [Mycolicibacterium pulveris]|uniref:Uncharacterized protein n=1 Tax=Mycolicibacterium pulveris TaxID=36813 RepID=A0A7I7UP12_MYCPV|nr:hypothetical protein MPUL_34370 [Mycolicibacterium pulveris]